MKIDQQNLSGTGSTGGVTPASLKQSSLGRSSSGGDSGDRVDISGVSRAIQTFQNDRSSRVSQLTKTVQSGSYNVDPAALSHSIVNEAIGAAATR